MGVGKLDETKEDDPNQEVCQKPGLILTLNEGDVIVHPAGTAHSNISDEGHYRYLACFPKVPQPIRQPHGRNEIHRLLNWSRTLNAGFRVMAMRPLMLTQFGNLLWRFLSLRIQSQDRKVI